MDYIKEKINKYIGKKSIFTNANSDVKGRLGKGQYGTCYLVEIMDENKQPQKYAMKKTQLIEGIQEYIDAEIDVLERLDHLNIVKFYGFDMQPQEKCVYIFMEYVDAGDLDVYLKKLKKLNKPMLEKGAWDIFLQACEGIQYMHSKRIMHRDIKPANIFLCQNEIVKIGDMGFAKAFDEGLSMAMTKLGTFNYMAPELRLPEAKNAKYNYGADVWALGVCLYKMLTQKKLKFERYYNSIDRKKGETRNIQYFKDIKSEFFQKLLSQIFDIDPKSRINMNVLVTELNKYKSLSIKQLQEIPPKSFVPKDWIEAVKYISTSQKDNTNIKIEFKIDGVQSGDLEKFQRLISKYNTIVYLSISIQDCKCKVYNIN